MDPSMILGAVGGLVVLGGLAAFVLFKKRTAYLGPVKEELQKEKMWLRRGEYNAAMVKGRQNLELLLRLVAEKNGIQLDNSAKAQADAKEESGRQNQNGGNGNGGRRKKHVPTVMTHQQFSRWLSANGYLDRVARWEMNQVRIIGNKAAHENYADKDEAWNQLNYLEDILKTVTEKSQNPKKRQEQSKRNDNAEKHVKVNRKKRGGAGEKHQEKPAKQKKAQNVQEKPAKQKKDQTAQEKPEKKSKDQTTQKKPANQSKVQKAQEKPVKQNKVQTVQEKKSKEQTAQEKPVKLSKAQNVEEKQPKQEVVQNPEAAAKKKRRRRRRKSGQKPATEGTVNAVLEVPKLEEIPEVKSIQSDTAADPMTDSEEVKKKSKRRRRRRKPKRPQNVTETGANTGAGANANINANINANTDHSSGESI